MLTNTELYEYIDALTNKKVGIDYCFEIGTFAPYTTTNGLFNAGNFEGYILRKGDKKLQITDPNLSLREKLKTFEKFLNDE